MLETSPPRIPAFDVGAVEEDPSSLELCKLLRLCAGVILKSKDNEAQLGAIQKLAYEHQIILMQEIENVIGTIDRGAQVGGYGDAQVTGDGVDAHPQHARLQAELRQAKNRAAAHSEQLSTAEIEVERLSLENADLRKAVSGVYEYR